MRKYFEKGGVIAALVLIAFGIGAIALGINGGMTVRDSLAEEKIVGSENMTVAAAKAEAAEAKLPAGTPLPTCDVAGKSVDTGAEARCFASYIRLHTLEATGGLTYAQMGRFASEDGSQTGTNDPTAAAKDETGAPIANGARNIWVTSTALQTALNTSYMAEQVALFGIVVGIALLLAGIGFGVLTLGGALRREPTGMVVPTT